MSIAATNCRSSMSDLRTCTTPRLLPMIPHNMRYFFGLNRSNIFFENKSDTDRKILTVIQTNDPGVVCKLRNYPSKGHNGHLKLLHWTDSAGRFKNTAVIVIIVSVVVTIIIMIIIITQIIIIFIVEAVVTGCSIASIFQCLTGSRGSPVSHC